MVFEEVRNNNIEQEVLGERIKVSLFKYIFALVFFASLFISSFVGIYFFPYLVILFIAFAIMMLIMVIFSIKRLVRVAISNSLKYPPVVYYPITNEYEFYATNKRFYKIPVENLIAMSGSCQLKIRFYFQGRDTTVFAGYCSNVPLIRNRMQERCKHPIK